jgi:hypothetical protein
MLIRTQVGTLACGLGTYIAMRRRRPPVNIGLRLLGAGGMGMMGSFIGFTIGGAAASMEVERHMPDAQRSVESLEHIEYICPKRVQEIKREISTTI